MGRVYQCWWRICLEINVFFQVGYQMFYILCQFVTCLLTLPSISLSRRIYFSSWFKLLWISSLQPHLCGISVSYFQSAMAC
jgi:hypothetical protein